MRKKGTSITCYDATDNSNQYGDSNGAKLETSLSGGWTFITLKT